MNIVIAPDSFKGCLTSKQAAISIEKGIRRVVSKAVCKKVPIADGGEGTVDALISALGGKLVYKKVTGPTGDAVRAKYGLLADARTAVIEIAQAAGLHLIDDKSRNPLKTTSFGVGELIISAIEKGAQDIIIGLGGSATIDGGMGMAQAIGVRFIDKAGRAIQQLGNGSNLSRVHTIDVSKRHPGIKKANIIMASDVSNPLFGKTGAAYVYGKQKGATPSMQKKLDTNLRHLHSMVTKHGYKDLKKLPGAGAAGGLGYGLSIFAQARMKNGLEHIAKMTGLSKHIANADLVITGEGQIDSQTAFGKTPAGIAKIARAYRVPVVAIGGSLNDDSHIVFKHGIAALESSIARETSLEESLHRAKLNIANAAERIMRLVVVGQMISKRKK